VMRDFAFMVPGDLPAESLLRAIRGADKAAITAVRLFDRFETSDGLSLAFEVTLQPIEKSFTDEQIGEISKRIVGAAEKLGERRRLAGADARAFRIDDDGPAGLDRSLARCDHVAQRFRASAALDGNDAIAPRQKSEERNIGELLLQYDHRQVRQAHHLERLKH